MNIDNQPPPPVAEAREDPLLRQMKELGTTDYWEAAHRYAERERAREQPSLFKEVFGVHLF